MAQITTGSLPKQEAIAPLPLGEHDYRTDKVIRHGRDKIIFDIVLAAEGNARDRRSSQHCQQRDAPTVGAPAHYLHFVLTLMRNFSTASPQ